MRNIVVFNPPRFKPLPFEITPQVIADAPLPVKIETAKRAIAECCDLSELLQWKDQTAALAAAAKAAKMPELAQGANRVCKEALLRMGQLLLRYKSPIGGGGPRSPRTKAATEAGIRPFMRKAVTRFAAAPAEVIASVLNNDKVTANCERLNRALPPQRAHVGPKYSDEARKFFRGVAHTGNSGLTGLVITARTVDISLIPYLTETEKQRARAVLTEVQEICDKIDQGLSR